MIMNGGGCGSRAVRPFPSHGGSAVDGETAACRAPSHCLVPAHWPTLSPTLSPSSVDHTVVRRQPSHCRHPRCFPPPSIPLLSSIDTQIVVAHVVVTHVVVRRRRRRHHDRRFRRYRCRFLADCCLWTLPGAFPAAPPPSLLTSFDDIILPPWASASNNAGSRRADARRSSGCCHPPPSPSVPARGDGSFALSLSSLLSPALAAAVAESLAEAATIENRWLATASSSPTAGGGRPTKKVRFLSPGQNTTSQKRTYKHLGVCRSLKVRYDLDY
jgi:hypothetical protein